MLHYDEVRRESKSSPKLEEVDHSEKTPPRMVASHFSNGRQGSILLMKCQVMIRSPNGSITQVKALLDFGSEAFFITKHSAQQLHLSCHHSSMVACIGGATLQD